MLVAVVLSGCGGGDSPPTTYPAKLTISSLSNRADLVSDGNVMLQIALSSGAALSTTGLKVDVDGVDVTGSFALRGDGRFTGVVTGLKNGANVITAAISGITGAKLTVTNSPRGGPVLSGAQIVPFFCATPTVQAATATSPATLQSGLSTTATDTQCNIATEYKLFYRTTTAGCATGLPDPNAGPLANACFKVYDPTAAAPADLATTTVNGATVPYIVRVERGTMNRGIYDIAVLFDPTKPWTGVAPQAQWTGKVVITFGASTGQPRLQTRPATAWNDERYLSRGMMHVVNSMVDSARNSNRVMMAETVMMMKEHINDAYGPIKYTLGTGCSGGSINSNMNASIAPGQLDGIVIYCAYPDSETTTMEVGDCTLLSEAYQKTQWTALMTAAGYTQAQINAKIAAINGHRDQTGCYAWYNNFGSNGKSGNYFQRTIPTANLTTGVFSQSATLTNNCGLPTALVYDPVTNPTGARCDAWSWATSIFGKLADNITPKDTRDNVGVQYGLGALMSGAITGEEFVTLNEIVGGSDKDSNFISTRHVANADALATAYKAGIVMSGAQIAKTAIIDMRGYDDSAILKPDPTSGILGIHHTWRSFSIRDRLDRDTGGHNNQALWRFSRPGLTPSTSMALDALLSMDTWLASLVADASSASLQSKVVSNRPATAANFCLLTSDAAQSTKVTDTAVCDADPFLVPASSPRQVAGGARTEDILKCQLKPVNDADYGGKMNAAQLTRLRTVFSTGVCDWSQPGVGQTSATSPLTFQAGPGGAALPPAPSSTN
jgi:hypothetical protein